MLIGVNIRSVEDYQNQSNRNLICKKKVLHVIKYVILRPNQFPEYIYINAYTKDMINEIKLTPKIYHQYGYKRNQGYWVYNPKYIPHKIVQIIPINLEF